jgi:endo-1,3-1,4-beta-glycanase ExoK
MAIIRSSRAITRTNRRRMGVRSFCRAAAVLALATSGCAEGKPAPSGQSRGGASFFDDFERLDGSRWYVSDGWVNGDHQACTWSRQNVIVSDGHLLLLLRKATDRLRPYRCAEVRTNAALGYGLYEARMRTAAGLGLNSAMFTYSGKPLTPTHDEIDFEFLGKSPGNVQLNYFTSGKGGHERIIPVPGGASSQFANYAFEWLPGSMKWYINGRLVRSEAGADLPVTPGQFFLSLWAGSATVDNWLGHYAGSPAVAQFDWAAFTRSGERCRFPQSLSCHYGG